jgi:RNA polymerase sigma factor (sigma-70 family)
LLTSDTYSEVIRGVRDGDQQAATRLVRACEAHVQKAVRYQLRYYGLDRVLESADISQTVFAAFFERKLVFRIKLNDPKQLLRLLARMARRRLMDEVRRHQADRRDRRRLDTQPAAVLQDVVAQDDASPSKVAAGNELLREVYRRLPADDRILAELRAAGLDWATIAQLRGATPESLRKRLARAIERVGHQMGFGRLAIV